MEGLNSGKIISKTVNKFAKAKGITNINQIKMPIAIPMTKLLDGELYVATSKQIRNTYSDNIKYISDMEISKAVEASCSYPLVFAPCNINNSQFVDGGVLNNFPVAPPFSVNGLRSLIKLSISDVGKSIDSLSSMNSFKYLISKFLSFIVFRN